MEYLFFILWLNTFFILYTMVQKQRGLVLIFITTRLCRNTYPPARDRFIKFRVKYTRSFHRLAEFHRSNILQHGGSSTHKMKIRSTRFPWKTKNENHLLFFSTSAHVITSSPQRGDEHQMTRSKSSPVTEWKQHRQRERTLYAPRPRA